MFLLQDSTLQWDDYSPSAPLPGTLPGMHQDDNPDGNESRRESCDITSINIDEVFHATRSVDMLHPSTARTTPPPAAGLRPSSPSKLASVLAPAELNTKYCAVDPSFFISLINAAAVRALAAMMTACAPDLLIDWAADVTLVEFLSTLPKM